MKNAGKYVLLFLTVACAIFIFSNSLRTAGSSSAQSGRLVRIFSDAYHALIGKDVSVDNAQKIVRKTAHFTEFAVLGLLAAWTVKAFYGKIRGRVFMLCFIAYSILIPVVVCAVFNTWPSLPDILPALLTLLAMLGVQGVLEAALYTPILGSSCYLTYATGNIMNLEIPMLSKGYSIITVSLMKLLR